MHQSIKKMVMILTMVVTLWSCNQGESLQSYYVNNQETPNFISLDLPANLVKIDDVDMTEVQREAYESIDKLNMLGYRLSEENAEDYEAELAKVKAILANEKYEELFRGGNNKDGRFVVKYIGSDTSIDELVVFGNANERGFAIVRVLGDDMEPSKILQLGDVINQMNFDQNGASQFMDFFQ